MNWTYTDEALPQEEGEYLIYDGITYLVDEWILDGIFKGEFVNHTNNEIVKYAKIE